MNKQRHKKDQEKRKRDSVGNRAVSIYANAEKLFFPTYVQYSKADLC